MYLWKADYSKLIRDKIRYIYDTLFVNDHLDLEFNQYHVHDCGGHRKVIRVKFPCKRCQNHKQN
jgi:hypothetical protein